MKIKRNKQGVVFTAENDKDRQLIKKFIGMSKTPRKTDTRDIIIDSGIALSLMIPYSQLAREDIAAHAKISPSLIYHYFENILELRKSILLSAIDREIPEIIAHGITLKDPAALAVPDWLRAKAAEAIKC